jgi:hypothetical protein
LSELQGRLAAMAEEGEHPRTVLARIGELIQRASEARPGPAGEAAPGVGPA